MIRINLLGQPRPRKIRAGGAPMEGAIQGIFVVVALLIGFGVLAVHYFQMKKDLNSLREQITSQTAERTRLQSVKADVDRLIQEKAARQQRINVIEQLQRDRTGGQELLDALANTVNRVDALWMTKVTKKGNTLDMEGSADSLNAVANFITELKRSGYYDKVEIKETHQDEKNPTVTTFVFSLTADFTLPSKGAAAQQAPQKTGKS
ncbi:MAG TPA: PilN domain-containing protein [Candidatus Acidoferrales bacterium]|nr:PilN domain-containing protein [Candidatus Acidoferrales bacterium]